MKNQKHLMVTAGLALTLAFGASASPGGCGGGEKESTPATATQPTTQPTDPTKPGQLPGGTSDSTTDQPPAISAKKATLTLNVRNATLEPLPGAPPRTILFGTGDAGGSFRASERLSKLPGFFLESPIRLQMTSAQIVGQSTASQLKSFKVYLLRVAICNEQGYQLNGPGGGGNLFQESTNCFQLYKAPEPGGSLAASSSYTVDQAKADSGNFVNLMDAKDLAAKLQNIPVDLNSGLNMGTLISGPQPGPCNLNRTCEAPLGENEANCPQDCSVGGTTSAAGAAAKSYVYGVFQVAPFVKVNGELILNDGRTLVSREGPVTLREAGAGTPWTIVTVENLEGTSGSSQEVAVSSYVGGIFKFQSPFTISQADLDSQAQFTLDIIFNPAGLLQGYRNPPFGLAQMQDLSGNSIFVSNLRVGPVPRRGSSNTVLESYLFTLPTYNARLDLYSVKDDPAKTIYAVDLRVIATKDTTAALADTAISYVVPNADDKIDFQNPLKTPIISGFTRLAAEGATGKAKVICSDLTASGEGTGWNLAGVGGTPAAGCASLASTIDTSYTLVTMKEIK
ncbi:MAG: hypothetical protein HYT87_00090 [Nitrospirae bacterium]|nr:hypothetical protein [Nitrospirota bacterium]